MTSSSINAPTNVLSENIYFDAYKEDKVRISCNACSAPGEHIWFEGNDWEHIQIDWLRMAIEHMVEAHPYLFETT